MELMEKNITWWPEETFVDSNGNTRLGVKVQPTFVTNLLIARKHISKKLDNVMLVTGLEGSGKSTLALFLARFFDDSFRGQEAIDRTVFTVRQFKEAFEKGKPGQAIIWDEAVFGMDNHDAATNAQNELKQLLVTGRYKRLTIILCIPSIFDLQGYFGFKRSKCMIRSRWMDFPEEGSFVNRGYFDFYSYDSKKYLFLKGKKLRNENAHEPDFQGFLHLDPNWFIDVKAYDAKKTSAVAYLLKGERLGVDKLSAREVVKKYYYGFMLFYTELYDMLKFQEPELTHADMIKRYNLYYDEKTLKNLYKNGGEYKNWLFTQSIQNNKDYQPESQIKDTTLQITDNIGDQFEAMHKEEAEKTKFT